MDFEIKEKDGIKYYLEKGVIQSIEPPASLFGFTYWSHMIPPYKPERVLMLGCGGHTIPKLIEKVWGKFDLTCNEKYDAKQILSDVAESHYKFDYIIVDLFSGAKMPEIVYDEKFIDNLQTVAQKLVAINTPIDTNVSYSYEHQNRFIHVATRGTEDNAIMFFKCKGDNNSYRPQLP